MADTGTDTGRYYDDRSLYFEEISGAERGATDRLLPRHTYILSTADLIARMEEPPTPRASAAAAAAAAAGPAGTGGSANRSKEARKKCVQHGLIS